MSINISKIRSELPENVLSCFDNFNIYYSPEYEAYLNNLHIDYEYMYNDSFGIIVQYNKILRFFKQVVLVSEPCPLKSPFIINEIGEIDNDELKFLDDVVGVLRKSKQHWISVTKAGSSFNAFPSESQRIPWGNYIVNLTQEVDTIFSNMQSKHRNMVRRGEKGQIDVKFGGTELLEDYILLDKETWKRSNVEVDNTQLYSTLLSAFPKQSIIAIAYKDSIPQAGILGLYNKSMFYYQYGASTSRPEPGSTHYLQWKMMLYMKSLGVRLYSFVGCRMNVDESTKLKSIQHFKEGFGGELKLSYTFKVIINKFVSKMFLVLFRLRWHKEKVDVVDQEISKWPNLN